MCLFNLIKNTHNKTKNENKNVTINNDLENKKLEKDDDEVITELLKQGNREIYFSLARW